MWKAVLRGERMCKGPGVEKGWGALAYVVSKGWSDWRWSWRQKQRPGLTGLSRCVKSFFWAMGYYLKILSKKKKRSFGKDHFGFKVSNGFRQGWRGSVSLLALLSEQSGHRLGGLYKKKPENILLTVREAVKSKVRVLVWWPSGEDPLPGSWPVPSCCAFPWWKGLVRSLEPLL